MLANVSTNNFRHKHQIKCSPIFQVLQFLHRSIRLKHGAIDYGNRHRYWEEDGLVRTYVVEPSPTYQ